MYSARFQLAVGSFALAVACGPRADAQVQTDAISREFTVWVDNLDSNPPITDSVSREFTVYVGTQPLRPQTDAVSREFTAWVGDFSNDPPNADAISREFTVYIGTQPLRPQTDAVSREFTAYVDPLGTGVFDAVSREFTVYTGLQPLREQTDCWSREFTVTNYPEGWADVNCDLFVNGLDIHAFVLALLDPANYAALYPTCDPLNADLDLSGEVSLLDIPILINMLLSL